MLITLSVIILVLLLIIGVPVPFAFMGSIVVFIFSGAYGSSFMLPFSYSKLNNIVILAVPLFIIAGGLANRAKIADKIIGLMELFVGGLRSSLGAIAVVSCAAFGAVTGSACATLSAIGSIMFPRLEAAGYPKGHSASLLASSSVLGMLIPPSSIMILYAWVGQTSVLACFLSTVFPGIILTILLCLVNAYLVRGYKGIKTPPSLSLVVFRQELVRRSREGLPALTMPILVLGGIYGGFVTPTEAAALSAMLALPLGFFIYKELTIRNVLDEVKEAAITTGAIMIMLYAMMILSRIYIMEDLPNLILSGLTSISSNPLVIFLMINLFIAILGMLMDDVSAILLLAPLLIPVVVKLGMNPVHFAAVLAVNTGMGNMTPPTAPLLYLSLQLNGGNFSESLRPTVYMLIFAWLPTLALTTYIPDLALFLPRLVLGGY